MNHFSIVDHVGSVDSGKSGLVRVCRTIVVVQGLYQQLDVELNDHHGNPVDREKDYNSILISVFLSEVPKPTTISRWP